MVRPYAIYVLIAILILLLSGGLFILFQAYFVSKVEEIPHVEHAEPIEISREEFIEMTTETEEEAEELRKILEETSEEYND